VDDPELSRDFILTPQQEENITKHYAWSDNDAWFQCSAMQLHCTAFDFAEKWS
jgi:hypothetical protein